MFKKQHPSVISIPMLIITVALIVYILNIGSSLLIPFFIALLASFAIIGLMNFYKSIKIPGVIAFILSIASFAAVFWGIGQMINANIDDLIRSLPEYQKKIYAILLSAFDYFKVTPPTSISQILDQVNLQSTFSLVFSSVTGIFSNTGIIMIYIIFILLEYRYMGQKLKLMIKDEAYRKQVSEVIDKIKTDVKSYFVIKAGISMILALLSYTVMTALGLDFAIFWAFLIFFLNFIPFIGSIVAVTFPILFSLVQFDSYYISAFMTFGLIGSQILMGNIVEPKFVGNKLTISPLVILLSLGFWGKLWGVVGMLLSVPIIVILNIILAKIPATRSIAVLLSEKGELQIEAEDEVRETRKQLLNTVKKRLKLNNRKKKK